MAIDVSQNYFALFALSEDYSLDEQVLAECFRNLQQVVHPDKFAMAGDQERRIAMQQASYLNQAYQTLKDPLLRARYLHGLRYGETEPATVHDLEFLEQQIQLRESLARAQEHENVAEIEAVGIEVGKHLKNIQKRIKDSFASEGQQEKILTYIDRWQFLRKLDEEIQQAEERLLGL